MEHIKLNGNVINLDKTWKHLSFKQKNWIISQFREEYMACLDYHGCHPGKDQYKIIVQNIYERIQERGIWLPYGELQKAFQAKLPKFRKISV